MHLVEVTRISYHPPSQSFAVLLKEKNRNRYLQIIVKTYKAKAIALYYEGARNTLQPRVHDMITNIIQNLGAEIKKVLIVHLDIQTKKFYAQIEISSLKSGKIIIDSKPSDAIAIAVRNSVPIYVSNKIMKLMAVEDIGKNSNNSMTSIDEIPKDSILENLNEALGKAIVNEEFELAAKLRDRIKEFKKKLILKN